MKTRKQSNKKSSNPNPMPPSVTPTPPDGYVYRSQGRLGLRPIGVQTAKAPEVAQELRAASDYTEQFGVGAPNAGTFADQLDAASAWSLEIERATAWLRYVTQQERLIWRSAMQSSAKLKPRFDQASGSDAELVSRYPALAAFFAATNVRGKRATSARSRNAKTKAKEAKANGAPAPSPQPVAALPSPLVSVHTGANGASAS
jgi:hypothetical protein